MNVIMSSGSPNFMVRKGGLEPPCLSAPPPQDGVSANSTTSASVSKPLNCLARSASEGLPEFTCAQPSPINSWPEEGCSVSRTAQRCLTCYRDQQPAAM